MYLKFKNIRLERTEYGGNDLVIKQVELRDEDGKFLFHPKINKELLEAIHEGKMEIKK